MIDALHEMWFKRPTENPNYQERWLSGRKYSLAKGTWG